MKHFPNRTKAILAAFLVAGLSSGVATGAEAHGKHERDARVVRVQPNGKARVAVRGIPHPKAVRAARVHPRFGRVDFGLYRHGRVWVARPAAPRSFVERYGRVTVVRPVPIWRWAPERRGVRVNVRYRSDDACAALDYARIAPEYGCAFCDDSFSSYGAWERHSRGCAHSEIHGRVSFGTWDAGDLDYFRAQLEVSHIFG